MNKLINEQKNLMDFSKYIEVNENNILENNGGENSDNSLLNNKKMNDNNNKLGNNIQNEISFNFQKEEKKKENTEYFKKLFQISEYLDFFLKENKQKDIKIKDNSNQINFSNNKKNMKKFDSKLINKDNQKNLSINIFSKNDMIYLWYMEAKERNNISLDYKIGKNYDELFIDV